MPQDHHILAAGEFSPYPTSVKTDLSFTFMLLGVPGRYHVSCWHDHVMTLWVNHERNGETRQSIMLSSVLVFKNFTDYMRTSFCNIDMRHGIFVPSKTQALQPGSALQSAKYFKTVLNM